MIKFERKKRMEIQRKNEKLYLEMCSIIKGFVLDFVLNLYLLPTNCFVM